MISNSNINDFCDIHAYHELYLPLVQRILGDMYDYAVNTLMVPINDFNNMFIVSGIAHQFEMGNPTYCAGKNGCEVAKEVIFSCTGKFSDAEDVMYLEKSSEYWIGWILAYYQWLRNIPFKNIFKVISMDDLVRMYPVYHEADVSMFVDTVDEKLLAYRKTNNQLKRLRMYAEYTQSKLSEESGVPIRQIQLFEQGQRDIRKAQTMTVLKLAKALHCKMEDLL